MAEAQPHRLVWSLLLICSVGLLATSIHRAAGFSFTHDESLSFAIFHWEPGYLRTANHHLLNTWLMRSCSILFGDSELSLRLPNVLAHGLYLVSSLLLLRRFRQLPLLLAGFALLDLNPFLLDFFSLARGYGLALGFLMLSLTLLVRALEIRPGRGFEKLLVLSVSAAALAVLANLAFLNAFLPLLLVSGILLIGGPARSRWAVGLSLAAAVFLAGILSVAIRLQRAGELFGGETGFIGDTLNSLTWTSLYGVSYRTLSPSILNGIWIGFFAALLLFALALQLRRREASLFGLSVLLLASAVLLPILQHHLLGTRFLTERSALYYVPLFSLALLSGLQALAAMIDRPWWRRSVLVLPGVIALALGGHFCRAFDPSGCYSWWYDEHNAEVLVLIDRDREGSVPDRMVRLGAPWMMEPSLNFYRVTRRYDWLVPLTRAPISLEHDDYIYAYEREIQALPEEYYRRLASYPDTGTALVRVVGDPDPAALP